MVESLPASVKQRLSGAFDIYFRPGLSFAGQFLAAIAAAGPLLLIAVLPTSAMLLLLPALLPAEAVIAETVRRSRSLWESFAGRLFAVGVGLAGLTAVVIPVGELVYWLGLSGALSVAAWLMLAYLVDLVLVVAIGRVPIAYNLRNLAVRWRITLSTALMFTVVVALLGIMLAFVNGIFLVIDESGQPGNVIILADGSTDEVFSNLGFGDVDQVELQVATTDLDGTVLAEPVAAKRADSNGRVRPLCSRETYAIVNQAVPGQARRRFVQVRGVVDPWIAGEVHGLQLLAGRWFSDAGVQTPPGAKPGERDQIEAVLGAGAAREFGRWRTGPPLAVGDTFELADRTWVVVGLLDSDGTTFGSETWAKQDIMSKLINKTSYTTLVMRVRDDGGRAAAARRADIMAHHLTTRFSNPKVNAQGEVAYYSKQSESSKVILYFIVFIALFMALGGVFGVMNTMFSTVAQRTKDIGVLRILGFKRWQILVSFLLESLAIALVGGLVGCALAYLADGWSATSSISSGQGGGKTVLFRLVVDAKIIMSCLLFTLIMGRLGGLIPALSAMRLRILDSLR